MKIYLTAILVLGLALLPVCGQDQAPVQPDKVKQLPIELKTKTVTLSGTLDLPEGKGPFPVVLVIAGSGPTNRDGNQPPFMINDSLKKLGAGLAARGIAVVRYDRRGVGWSALAQLSEKDLRLDMLADDAAAWIKQLRADPRFTRVGVLGHSEGALVGLLAAKQVGADAYVSLAGCGRKPAVVLREQLKKLPPALREQSDKILDELSAGRTVNDPPKELKALFRPNVQPYLISWFKYDPAQELAALRAPTLIVQGTSDIQIAVVDAKCLAAAKKDARLFLVQDMNHVLRVIKATEEQKKSYFDATRPLAPGLVEEVAGFLHKSLDGKH